MTAPAVLLQFTHIRERKKMTTALMEGVIFFENKGDSRGSVNMGLFSELKNSRVQLETTHSNNDS